VGAWLAVNGEGIYGSKAWAKLGEGNNASGKLKVLPAGPLGRKQAEFRFTPDDFRFTVGKNGSLYAYCLTVPAGGTTVKIKSLKTGAKLFGGPVKSVALLGGSEQLNWIQTTNGLAITLPSTVPGKYVIGFKIN
jgi:alpha-L-fucosidase